MRSLSIHAPREGCDPEELEQFRQDNEKGVDIDGRHYTMYEATQMQRKLERAIRAQKKRILVDESTGDQDKLLTDQIRYQRLEQEYRRFSKAAGLRTQHERAEVVGFTGKEGTSAIKGANHAVAEVLAKARNGDTIVLNEDLESLISEKPFEDIQDLCGKLSDRAARKWYLTQDGMISDKIDRSQSLEGQARAACELRNLNRTHARELMRDQVKRQKLDITDPNKSFEELLADKMLRKGLSREDAIADILRTTSKTRKSVNKALGLE